MAIDDHKKELTYCTFCPKLCRHACPVSNALGHEALIPQSKMQILEMLRRGAVSWQQSFVEPLYACTGCRLCQEYCEHGNDVARTLWEGRAAARERGLGHPALERLPERLRQRNEQLRRTLERSPLARHLASQARVGFVPGFDSACSLDDPPADGDPLGDIHDAFFVFERLGLDFVCLADGLLSGAGYALWAGGFTEAARFHAEELCKRLRNYSTLVVGSAAAAWLLRVFLPEQGFDHGSEVLHLTEFLAPHAERLEVRRRRFSAFYHDPCYLGRHLGVYDAPRRLLARCVESPREFFHHREKAECCGGGGLVPQTYPEATTGQALHRLEEPQLFGVDVVVTACPTCKRSLQSVESPLQVLDLINLLAWSLREPEQLEAHES
jgi:Fe-S oxidoreductase